ncbi:hypothetical protein [Flavobacterium sp. DG2-3]|uniref:hypothetical protein n=1 Tax=Flavobacterium sp. DG2-3 TaxID=3068317 RepID=UPI00273D45B7|nr:hypothetical protein [Flavobacterium sp. DG2-3]MDP5201508.1 hypothetical protein [Flavobacterium sp. DG2-3]
MAILKHNSLFSKLLFFFFSIIFISCKEKVDCNNDGQISNTFSFPRESNYLPQKGNLYFFEKNSENKDFFKVVDLRHANIIDGKLNIFFNDIPDHLNVKYNYKIVLDDSLVFEIMNMQMKVDTMGRTMGGWAITCRLMSFEVNGKKYNANEGTLDFPFNSAKKIK